MIEWWRDLTRAISKLRPIRASPRVVPLADYDKNLRVDLRYRPSAVQAAFAAACAERLYPSYERFVAATGRADDGLIRATIDHAWEGASTGTMSIDDWRAWFERCVALIPRDDEEGVFQPTAEDAISAAAYALQAAAGLDDGSAGMAATCVTDAVDDFLLSNEIDIEDPDSEERVWRHPLVQTEVARREEDLRDLREGPDWAATVDAVRARARGVSALPM